MLDDAERRRVLDPMRWIVASAPAARWNVDERGDVEIGQHVTVGDDERVVDAGVLGGEPDRAGRVERLGLDGVVERDAAAPAVGEGLDERLGQEAEGQRDVGRRRRARGGRPAAR